MSQIIKAKFLCKTGCKTAPRTSSLGNIKWTDTFIEDKWYDGEYETWSWEDGYKCNNGWRRYWVVNEQGIKEEISKSYMRSIFKLDIDEIRDSKIEEILKK
jgi:hypothetical protein